MSGTIDLFCWVIGTPAKQIFPIKVGFHEVWGSVKDAIKEKKKNGFAGIDADTLDLWKVRHCTSISHVVLLIPEGHHRSFPNSLGIGGIPEGSYGHEVTQSHRFFVNGIQGSTS